MVDAAGIVDKTGSPNESLDCPDGEQSDRCLAWQFPSYGENLPFWTHLRQSPFKASSFPFASVVNFFWKSL